MGSAVDKFVAHRVVVPAVVGMALLASVAAASETRLDLRLRHEPLDERLRVPRLQMEALKEKEAELAVQATRKRRSRTATTPKVSKARLQRKEKTRKVVAAQQ